MGLNNLYVDKIGRIFNKGNFIVGCFIERMKYRGYLDYSFRKLNV